MLETRRRKGKPNVSKPDVTTDYNVYEIVISYLDIRFLSFPAFRPVFSDMMSIRHQDHDVSSLT